MVKITFIPDPFQQKDLKLTGTMWFTEWGEVHSCQCEIEEGSHGFVVDTHRGETTLPEQLHSGAIKQVAEDMLRNYWLALWGKNAFVWMQG